MADARDATAPHTQAGADPNRRVVLSSRGGRVEVEIGVPPRLGDGEVLIRTAYSVVSPGTERSKLELSSKSLIGKARARPDLVRETLEKLRREGATATLRAVRRRLGEPVPLGYASAGTVLAVGSRVEGVRPGDRVAAGGGGYALHADVVAVPRNLVAPVPEGVPLDAAAFATIGSVAMHAFRLSRASLGETVAVVGLGLVGLLAGAIARAAGCRVLGVDVRPEALERARKAGFDRALEAGGDVQAAIEASTGGRGVDAVLLCAAAKDNAPLVLAGRVARDRARVVVVGEVPVEAPRDLFYGKELELVVSRSYGPGRYDPEYEERGRDYPAGYVRWTEGRNLEAFLDLLAQGRLDPLSLVTHRLPVDRAPEAYDALASTPGAVVLLEYGEPPQSRAVVAPRPRAARPSPRTGAVRVGLVGTGSFAERVLLPALEKGGAEVVAVASLQGRPLRTGPGAPRLERSAEALLAAEDVEAVVVATRHDSHAALAAAALEAGKPVLVEKPLALSWEELERVTAAWRATDVAAMIGFNRRHAPLAVQLREALARRSEPAVVSIRVNAGPLADDHWARDLDVGGGRILGEMCHFVDLAAFLLASDPVEVSASATAAGSPRSSEDVAATVRHADGSVAVVLYTALGDPGAWKERIEVFAGGASYAIEDWRRLLATEGGRTRSSGGGPADKGHEAEVAAFLRAVREGGDDGFPLAVRSTAATLAIVDSISLGHPVEV